jgi:nicotinate-nucleotide adenylyltransferase
MTTGLLGGTFDPPHNGHIALANAAVRELGLERIVVMVAGQPPHKESGTEAETRYRLARAAFEALAKAELPRNELDRPGPAYTVDTVKELERRFGEIVLVLGGDEFASFPTWREPDRIVEHARVAVAARPGTSSGAFDAVLAQLRRPDRVMFFAMPAVDISASEVRRRVAAGEPYDDLVPPEVAQLIEELGLYKNQQPSAVH